MKKVLIILVIGGLIFMIPVTAVAGYLIGATVTKNNQALSPTPTAAPGITLTPTSALDITATPPVSDTDKWLIDRTDLPVVSFSPGGLFTDTERTDFIKKVVEPATMYYNETELDLVAVQIMKDSGDVIIDFFGLEATSGFVYGSYTSTADGYWYPECMDGCTFSPAFTAKYPDIVSASNPF